MTRKKPAGALRLGVNIDHVATVRNARGVPFPDPVRAARLAEAAGADGITAHLREDRRHITDADIDALMAELWLPLNLEMAATPEMQAIALRHRPHAVCLVPERREERTTEGGWRWRARRTGWRISSHPCARRAAASRSSSPPSAVRSRRRTASARRSSNCTPAPGARWISAGDTTARDAELARLRDMAAFADSLGLEVHAGHGLTFDNVAPVAAIPQVRELNIGHFLIGEAIFVGLEAAIRQMRAAMDAARAGVHDA